MSPPNVVSRAFLRPLVRDLFPTDSELEAFCLDSLPAVQERFTNGMDRLSKVNLMLQSSSPAELYALLIRTFGQARIDQAQETVVITPEIAQGPDADGLGDDLVRLYRARAKRQADGQPHRDLDDEIRRIKQIQRQKPQLREGEVLGDRYQLMEVIGRGGFGKVWQAHDLRDRQRLVAVKILHSEQAEDQGRIVRFERGAIHIKPLNHPHIVKVLDGPAEECGFRYFVMQYLPGGDLQEAVLKQRLDPHQALRAVLQAGAALSYSHSLGLIHRDVKPQNILLDHSGSACLTDFDLVLAADSTGGTRTGAMMGTFLYAAPEALEDGASVDERADVYSLAMTAMFVLYGKPLPARAVPHRGLFIDSLPCSEEIRDLLRYATAVDPDDRPTTVAEFCAGLELALQPTLPAVPLRCTEQTTLIRVAAIPQQDVSLDLPLLQLDSELLLSEEPSQTTPSVNAEQRQLAPRSRRGHVNSVMAGFFITLLLGGFAYRNRDRLPFLAPNPERDAAQLVLEIESDLESKRWESALAKGHRLQAMPGVSQSLSSEAQAKLALAAHEARNQQIFSRFSRSATAGDYDAAIEAYRELPEQSVYKPSARENYEGIFALFVMAHLRRADDARARGECLVAQSGVKAVLDVDSSNPKALAAWKLPCSSPTASGPVTSGPSTGMPKRSGGKGAPVQDSKSQASGDDSGSLRAPLGPAATKQGPESSNKDAANKPDISSAEADAVLAEAQTNLVNGNYAQAISQARQMIHVRPDRAWRVIGGAACRTRNLQQANEAYRRLDFAGQWYMNTVCQSHGLQLSGTKFKLAPREAPKTSELAD